MNIPDLKVKSLKISVSEIECIYKYLLDKNNSFSSYGKLISKLIKEKKIVELLKLTLGNKYNENQKRFLKKIYKKEDVNYLFNPSIYERLFIDKISDYEEIIDSYFPIIKINIEKFFTLLKNEKKDEVFYLMKYKDIINWSEVVEYLNKDSNLYSNDKYDSIFQYFDFKNVRRFHLSFFNNINKFSENNLKTINLKFLLFSLEDMKNKNIKNKDEILNLLISEKIIFDNFESNFTYKYENSDNLDLIKNLVIPNKILEISSKTNNERIIRHILINEINIFQSFYEERNYNIKEMKWYNDIIFYSDIIISEFEKLSLSDSYILSCIRSFLNIYKKF